MVRLAYVEAMKLAGDGALVVLNQADELVIWHTPAAKLPEDALQRAGSDDKEERQRFAVEYAAFAPR